MTLISSPSILRKLLLSFLAFGLGMGIIFPFYAKLFVIWKPGMESWFVIGCLIAGTSIGISNYFLTRVILLKRLQQMATVTTALAEKDLTQRCVIKSNDLIGQMVSGFNSMANNLHSVLQSISAQTLHVNEAVGDLHQVADSTQEHAQRQQQQTNMARGLMQQMTETLSEIVHASQQAAETANETQSQTQDGVSSVSNTSSVVEQTLNSVEHTVSVIQNLAQETNHIESVLGVITDIAEQTNLLALNAAIEAARAGDQGRGFAVVADEVRSLATRTQQSTKEIREMIERLQSGADEAIKTISTSQDHARQGVELAEKTGVALSTIQQLVDSTHQWNGQIADATNTYSQYLQEMQSTVESLDQLAMHSVSNTQQAQKSSSDLSELSEELKTIVSGFTLQ